MVTEGRGDAPQDKAPAAERDGGAVSDPSNWSDDKPAPGTKSRALADTDVADGDGTNRANANVHSGEDYEGATLQSDAPRDAGPAFASQGVSDGDGRTAVADEGHPLDRSTGTAHRPQEERTGAPDMAASRDDHPGSDNTIAAMPLPPRDAEHAQQADTPARAQPPLDAHAGPAPGPASGPDPDANPGGHAEPEANRPPETIVLNGSSVAENAEGAVVGKVSGVDPDEGDTLTYTVSDDRFEVVDGSVKLKDGVALDHEAESEIALEVTATDKAGATLKETFTVTVEDLNERPTAVLLDGRSVEENHSGAVIGTLSGVDPDDGDTLTYTVSDDRFEVVHGAVKLRDGVALDHEAEAEIALEVTATDQSGASLSETFTVKVEDLNEGPTAVSLDRSSVAENAAGAVIGTLSGVDPDHGDTLTYTLSDDRFEMVDGAVKLKDGVALDHEAESEIALKVTATDQSGATLTETFTVTVEDLNEGPTAVSLDGSAVAENAAGAVVGMLSGVDPDDGDTLTYSVSDDRFEVVDGAVKLKDGVALDHEAEAEIALEVTATDRAGASLSETFRVKVEDLNEGPTAVSLDGSAVAENAAGAVVGTLSGVDPDDGDTLTYSVSDDRFEVLDGAVKLKDGVALDHEAEAEIALEVTATDQAGATLTEQFTVTVEDLNEGPTAVSLDGSAVAENAAGAVVGTLSAVDPDVGDTLTFTVSDDRFEVVDGAVKLKEGIALDHEAEAEIALEVTATDQAGATLTEQFDVFVNDVNEAPTDITLTPTAPVADTPPETGPVDLSTSVIDVGDRGKTYTFDLNEIGALKVIGNMARHNEELAEIAKIGQDGKRFQNNQLGLVDPETGAVDPELVALIRAAATESGDPAAGVPDQIRLQAAGPDFVEIRIDGRWSTDTLRFEGDQLQSVYKALSDLPVFADLVADEALPGGMLSVAENASGAVIGRLSGVDPDDGDILTYTLSDDRFEVVDGAVKLKNGVALDHEAEAEIALEVTATDQAGATLSETFTVVVEDLNEGPTAVSLDGSSVAENAAGAVVGMVSGVDPDDDDTLTYTLSDDRFEVLDGAVKLKDGVALDHEAEVEIALEVTATDQSGATLTEQFTVTVEDLNEGPTAVSLDGSAVAENASGAVVGMVSGVDPDDGDTMTYTLSDDRFEVLDGSVKLKDGVALDHEAEAEIALEVTATDQAGATLTETFTVVVEDLNEAPTAVSLDGNSVAENAEGAVIGMVSGVDPDDRDTLTYTLSDHRFEVLDGAVKPKDGVALDHEAESEIALEVTATDQAGATLTEQFTVTVEDINEAPTALSISVSQENLIKNGSFEAFDLDTGRWRGFDEDPTGAWQAPDGMEVWDNLGNNAASEGDQLLELDHGRGVDSISQTIETQPGQVYDLGMDIRERRSGGTDTVEVYWNGDLVHAIDPDTSDWTTFQMRVVGTGSDVLELREPEGENDSYGALIDNLTLTAAQGVLAENTPGAVVGLITVEDADAQDSHEFSLSDDRFEVIGGVVKLKDGVALDHETEAQITLEVTATDRGGASHSERFDLHVADMNDAPVILGFEAARPTMPLDVPRPGDTVTLDVTLGGEAYRGDPKYEIVVDGKTVARGEVDWSRETTTDGKYDLSDGRDAVVWKDVSVALEFPPGGFDTVEVRFKNDAYRKGVGDRNLLVDKIAIDGHVIEAEAPEVHYQGGRFKDGATSERMPWRGDLEFDVSAIFEHADPRPAPEGPYVLEGVPGAIVGTLNVSDADLGDSVTISVSDDRFDVVDGALKLKDGVALEFDEASAVAVTVTATDQAGVSADLIVDLTVVDVGELPEPPSIAVEPAFQLAYFDPEAEVAGDQSALSDPVNVGALDAISFDAGGAAVEGMAAQISGQIQAPQDGSFTFLLGDGANTTVFIDGVAVIDNSKAGPFPLTQGVIELEAGTHQIEAIHRDPTAARVFDLSWEGPGLDGGAVAPARAADGDALGIAGEPVDLALDIAADSVVASVTLSGLPTGSIVEASGDLVQADDAGDFDLTGLQNAPLSITPPSDFEGDVSAALTVRDMYGAEVVQPVEIAVSAPPWDAPASTDSASADEEFESVSFAGADETRPDPGSEGAAPEVIEIAQTDDDMSESQSFVGAET
ncbi:MAG: carbohydrate-binding domain-containing protein [Pseudomonadota bacterium]